jgi:hypothetical protein
MRPSASVLLKGGNDASVATLSVSARAAAAVKPAASASAATVIHLDFIAASPGLGFLPALAAS